MLSLTLTYSDVSVLRFVSSLARVHTALTEVKTLDKTTCISPFIIVLK